MEERAEGDSPRVYQIGTVSSLTGLDTHTIRAWERRYGAIKPARSESGRRQYDDAAIERLQLLKGLVDCSEPIGTIAHLSDEALRERLTRLAEHEGQRALGADGDADPTAHLALLAPELAMQIDANAVALFDCEVGLSVETTDALLAGLAERPCDIVVLELNRLGDQAPRIVQACLGHASAPRVVVLHRFAARHALAKLSRVGAVLVRSPIRLDSLRQVIRDQLLLRRASGRRPVVRPAMLTVADSAEASSVTRPQRFDDAQLARLFELTSAIDCECPNHMSSLVSALVAFERYSRDCESRDEADAALHARLADGTGQARAAMEDLLAELCEHEGIQI